MWDPRVGRLLYYLLWPEIYVYLRIGTRTRVVVTAGDKGQEQILLVRSWLGDGRYKLPGGGLHRGERSSLGAVREVLEETVVPLLPEQCQLLATESVYDGGLQFTAHFFAAHLERPIQAHAQKREIVSAEWLPLSEVPHLDCKAEVTRALKLLGGH